MKGVIVPELLLGDRLRRVLLLEIAEHRADHQTLDHAVAIGAQDEPEALRFLHEELFIDQLIECILRAQPFGSHARLDLRSSDRTATYAGDDIGHQVCVCARAALFWGRALTAHEWRGS